MRLGARIRAAIDARFTLIVLGVYLFFRAVSFVVITWVSHHQPADGIPGGPSGDTVTYWDQIRIWDGEWYQRIVTHGYPSTVPTNEHGVAEQSQLAFYPLYPMMVRLFMACTGADFAHVAGILSLILGCIAALLMGKLLIRHVSPVVALCAIAVYSSSAPAPTLQMAYTESLAMALLAAILLAIEHRNWTPISLLAIAIGLSRPIGVPLACVVAAVLFLRWRERGTNPITRAEWLKMGTAGVLCVISGYIWPTIAGLITGQSDAYQDTMAAWRPHHEIIPFYPWWHKVVTLVDPLWGPVLLIVGVIAFFALLAGPWARGLGIIMRVWCAAYAFYLLAVLDVWTSTYRYLLMLFPMALIALGASHGARNLSPELVKQTPGDKPRVRSPRPPTHVVVLTGAWILVGTVLQIVWAWYLLRFVPPAGNPV